MTEEGKRRLGAAAQTTLAAMLGTGAGYGAARLTRDLAAQKLGPAGTKAFAMKHYAPIMAAGALLGPALNYALRDEINKKRKEIEQKGKAKEAGVGGTAIGAGIGALGGGLAGYRAAGPQATLGQRFTGALTGAGIGAAGGALGGRMAGKGVAQVAGAVKEPMRYGVAGLKSAVKGGPVGESLGFAAGQFGEAARKAVPAILPAGGGLAVGGLGLGLGGAGAMMASKAVGQAQREQMLRQHQTAMMRQQLRAR